MTRTDFIKAVAVAAETTQKNARAIIDAAQAVAYEAMANEDTVAIFDGLKLSGVRKEACVRRNPLTGEDVKVPEKVAPKAKFGAVAKRAVNGEEI